MFSTTKAILSQILDIGIPSIDQEKAKAVSIMTSSHKLESLSSNQEHIKLNFNQDHGATSWG